MEQFIDYVLQFGTLNKQQIDLILSKATAIELRQDELYWEAGKPVKMIGFLTHGVLRVYYHTKNGDEHTRYFIDENHLILDGPASEGNYTPAEYLQAITDCTLVVFSKKHWQEITEAIPGWESIVQKITAKHHIENWHDEVSWLHKTQQHATSTLWKSSPPWSIACIYHSSPPIWE